MRPRVDVHHLVPIAVFSTVLQCPLWSVRNALGRNAGEASLRRILGDLVDTPAFTRAVELLTVAAFSAPLEGRPRYAALRTLPVPEEPVARLFRAASLLREHRGDGHISALMAQGIGGLEAHVLVALDLGIPAEKSGGSTTRPRSRR